MTKKAKTITYAAGIFTAFWLIIAFLITSVEAVAYWTPGYYEKEYTKYQVLNDLPEMTMDDLLDVTDQMMAFLRGKREDLHVYTTMGGEYREFFNDRGDRAHGGCTGTLYRRSVAPQNRDRGHRSFRSPGLSLGTAKTQSGPERSNG